MAVLLNILVVLLKIIGFALLAIMLFLLLVLLVPVRYRAKLERDEKDIRATAEVRYFLRFLRLPISFQNHKLSYQIRVLGFTLIASDGKRAGGRKKRRIGKRETQEEETADGARELEESNEQKQAETATDWKGGEQESRIGQNKADGQESREESDGCESPEEADGQEKHGAGEETIFFQCIARVRQLFLSAAKKIRAWIDKIKAIVQNIRETLQRIFCAIRRGGDQCSSVKEFIQNEIHQNGAKYAGKTIFKLLKHTLPYKIKGELTFGTGDPYSMGQALSVLGMLYPLYARKLTIKADFETDCLRLEGKLFLKGRIRAGSILLLLIKLWLKGEVRKTLRNLKELKEKLAAPAAAE